MTAAMPQPPRLTPGDYRDIADLIDAEAMRIRVANDGIASVDSVHLQKTARYLRVKAARMEKTP